MEAETQALVAFFLTGRRESALLDTVDGLGLRPALFSGYGDLTALRYDFPLVLVANGADGSLVRSLSGVIDDALASAAHGGDAERVRHHALRLEQELRTLAPDGGALSALWNMAASRIEPATGPSSTDSLRRVRAAIAVDGEIADCDAALPARLLRHAWNAVQQQKARAFRKEIDRLVLRLTDIVKASVEHSEEGRRAERLKASVGAAFDDAFDFDALSRTLATAGATGVFPESRRSRIRELLAEFTSQRFFPSADAATAEGATPPYTFVFDSCRQALEVFRERMPALVRLARAVAIAELEIDGLYRDGRHDALFDQFGANGLDAQDLGAFPDYLVCVNAGRLQADEHVHLMEILTSGLPIKVLLQIDDILEESPYGEGRLTSGTRSRQIASMAIGLNEVYVLQSSSSNLFRFRDRIVRGLTYRGSALFSVFSGASGHASGLPPYLVAAAAMESRAFPAFVYDPSAGPDWASRFGLEANSQVDLDWPVQSFAYEDDRHQRVTEGLAFTMVDFVASDRRYARHLAKVQRSTHNGNVIPVDELLARERKGLPDAVPCLLMVDEHDRLHTVIVDERLIREARRCRDMWHSLQELGGVHNSHAEALLARERKTWEAHERHDGEAPKPAELVGGPVAPARSNVPAAVVAIVASMTAEIEPERSRDEAYIETARCSTCNECTTINNKMFAYNGNRQAYLADRTAGTYAQLVEAAESCQVSVIHPGKPHNPNEPGIEELLKRAAPFL